MQTSRSFTTRIDISEQSRRQLIELLNARLADAFDLYSQLKRSGEQDLSYRAQYDELRRLFTSPVHFSACRHE
jgi:hypothetical protein